MKKIGFIGLGVMGKPMSERLLEAGYPLTVYDINQSVVEEMTTRGARRGTSPKDVALNSEIVVTMLPNSPQVKEAVFGPDGILEGVRQGQILIDMSSIAPLVSKEISEALKPKGVEMLDAPVSGGQEKAKAGALAIMVGGKPEVFEQCKDLLSVMGKSVTWLGEIGAGQIAKLVNQAIVAVNIAVVAEALTLGKRAGMDPELIFQAVRKGLAGSQCLEDKAPRMFASNFDPGFKLRLHVKDLANVLETSRALNTAMPLTAQVMEMMQALLADGHAEKDHGGLALYYEKINGISLKTEAC